MKLCRKGLGGLGVGLVFYVFVKSGILLGLLHDKGMMNSTKRIKSTEIAKIMVFAQKNTILLIHLKHPQIIPCIILLTKGMGSAIWRKEGVASLI
jgi:hypothetical protein